MNIAKQIIDQRVNNLLAENPGLFEEYSRDIERQRSMAFLLLGVAAYLNIDIAEAVPYLTDGSSDGGFDAAYINQLDGRLDVVLFQSKYVRDLEKDSNFPANAMEKAVITVQCVFDPNRCMQLNEKSKEIVSEIQSYILDGDIPYVTFVMLNNGLAWNQDGQNHINNAFKDQKQIEFTHFNHDHILQYIHQSSAINSPIQFNGAAIQEDFNYKRVMVGRVSITEIHKLMEDHGDALLEKNIRKFLGINSVNRGIRDTLLDDSKKHNFFFYNNGITMVCEKFRHNGLQKENWLVQTENLQIINGGQTCKTIYQTMQDHPDKDFSELTVLVRLYEVGDDKDIIQGVTVATNSQNPVDLRDLKANDDRQSLLEQNAKELGYTYKRKKDNQPATDTIPSSVAAEAVFTVWRQKPYLAKYKKNEFFGNYYDEIFTELNAAQMIIAVLIFRYCDSNRKKRSKDYDIQAQRAYSQYLLSTMMGIKLLKGCAVQLNELDHTNFEKVRSYFENNKEDLYNSTEADLIKYLDEYLQKPLSEIDGRTMAAIFRRFEFVNQLLGSGL